MNEVSFVEGTREQEGRGEEEQRKGQAPAGSAPPPQLRTAKSSTWVKEEPSPAEGQLLLY